MNVNRTIILSIVFGLAGCVGPSVARLNTAESLPATVPQSVDIYTSRADIPGNYREVALLDSDGNDIYSDYARIYKMMRKKAAAVGANGVLLGEQKDPKASAKFVALFFDGEARRQISATAIIVENKPLVLAPVKKRR